MGAVGVNDDGAADLRYSLTLQQRGRFASADDISHLVLFEPAVDPMTEHSIEELSDANFDVEISSTDGATVVQFWAPWSSACRVSAGSFEEVAQEFEASVKSARINVDVNAQTATHYGVTNLPTFVLFVDGEAIARISGSASRERLRELFEQSEG